MDSKRIDATDLGPAISLDATGIVSITGKSRMEDASLYYQETHEWVKNYINEGNTALTVRINLTYFNSSSAKQLLKLLMLLDEANINGKVIWLYPTINDILLERGQELEIMLDLPFEYHGYTDIDGDFKISE